MAMDYPNPLHWDQEFARESRFGGIVAPQSIAVALDYGHGAAPACVGHIPRQPPDLRRRGVVVLRLPGPAGRPAVPGAALPRLQGDGDEVRRADDVLPRRHRSHATSTAPWSRASARPRSGTCAPRRPSAACTRASSARSSAGRRHELDGIEQLRQRVARCPTASGVSPRFDEVKVGDTLPRRVIGPHSIASFTTEYRAFLFNIWGTFGWVAPAGVEDPWVYQDPGWVEGFAFDEEGARIDPRKRDGLYVGPSRGHIDDDKASEVGMARAYGYGATMGAWCTDYLAYWAGHDGMVRHTKADFRGPAFEGDVTYFDAEVIGKRAGVGVGRAAGPGQAAPDQPGRRRAGGLHRRGRAAALT